MKPLHRLLLAAAIAAISVVPAQAAPQSKRPGKQDLPRVFCLDPQLLAQTRQRIQAGDRALAPALARLQRDADRAVRAGTLSVTSVDKPRPSGDPHDYVSLARYYWPDPNQPNGLPYVRRDGETNPAIEEYCSPVMANMAHRAYACALAYYLSGNEAYAAHAAKMLRVWFLDPATRMNPNLRFAQFIPGRNDGRGAGLIDSRDLAQVVDAAGLLAGSPAWTARDQQALVTWFGAFLEWTLTSSNGRKEAAAKNNHGVWYDVQTTAFALFVGRDDVARKILTDARSVRIAPQIEPDGSMPLELARTKSFDYSLFNVAAFFDLATEAQNVNIDLWNYQTADGRSIRKALDYLLPYTVGGKTWEHQQIKKFDPDALFPLLRRAAIAYHEPQYEARIAQLPPKDFTADRTNLLFPANAVAPGPHKDVRKK